MPKTDVKVRLVGEDGNAFFILGRVKTAMEDAGYFEEAKQMIEEATSGDYNHLLQIVMAYVEVE